MLWINHIGKQIKERRDSLRITQVELSELADISPNTLYKIERGQANPSLKILLKITEILGLEISLVTKKTSPIK
jgi:transcriptional regulator with XRE-family HTH domain